MKRTVLFVVLLGAAMMIAAHVAYAEQWFDETDGEYSSDYDPPSCEVPPSAATVTVRQEGDSPIYEFTITNHHTWPLSGVSLGWWPDGSRMDSYLEELYPVEYIVPDGWIGESAGEGSSFGFLYSFDHEFLAENVSRYYIKPGATLTGFKIIMRKPFDFMKVIPYKAYFSRGSCMFGTVLEASE